MDFQRPKPHQVVPESAEKVFSGVIFDLYQWLQKHPDGRVSTYEVAKRRDGATIIPVTEEGKIVMLRQKQDSWQTPLVCFPGGIVDAQEGPEAAAIRELREEAGYAAAEVELWLGEQIASRVDWALYTFIGRGCKKAGAQELDSGEQIEVLEVGFEEMMQMVERDDFRHLDLAVHFLKMKLHPEKLKAFRDLLGV